MKGKLTAKKLSNGTLFIFDNSKKDLFLITKANAKHWQNSAQDYSELKELVKNGKAKHFDKGMLSQISDALTKVALLG